MKPTPSSRRWFLRSSLALAIASAAHAAPARRRSIVLRSSWQTVNIGDIAHTPGVLALLEKHLPDVEVRLWPSRVDNGADVIIAKRFPQVAILRGEDDYKAALKQCDFMLHGSGPSLVAQKDLARWHKETRKPFGVYGITLTTAAPGQDILRPEIVELLSAARFVYCRDSVSLQHAREKGVASPILAFGPDGAFATDLRDDAAADAFLSRHHLEPGKFLCVLSRFRITPYWLLPEKKAAFNQASHDRNQAMKEHDHAPLRQAIIDVVRKTDLKILLCPEDKTQMAIGREMFLEKLPADVLTRVVWRPDYWLTAEALSTYIRSAGLFGSEMHSPIMAVGNGVPAIVCRWQEQTTKGYMWRDIGLGDWLFHFDEEADLPRVAPTVLAMAQDLPAARQKTAKARDFVMNRFKDSMVVLAGHLG
jgi:polysaccharide pyruvyl transferase WcaK-like protein